VSIPPSDLPDLRKRIKEAAREIALRDPRVHAVGLAARRGELALRAVRNADALLAQDALQAGGPPAHVQGLPVLYEDVSHPLVPLTRLPGVAVQQATLPEQARRRPLALGLQVQNIEHDLRAGAAEAGFRTVGTLGCFVLSGGAPLMLSNNHVLAGENEAEPGDRVQQPGALDVDDDQVVGYLTAFVPLRFSEGGHLGEDTEALNVVDAATARLRDGTPYRQAYLPYHRALRPPLLVREPSLGERVYKVGRTTGLTRGQVSALEVLTGPVGYGAGAAFFERSFAVRGLMGTQFSSGGDSGSAIVAAKDGALLGLLYEGDGVETYACPAGEVLAALTLTLIP